MLHPGLLHREADLRVRVRLTDPQGAERLALSNTTRLVRETLAQKGNAAKANKPTVEPVNGPDDKPLSGLVAGEFRIPEEFPGGEYTLQMQADDGTIEKRTLIVSSYEAPRLKKTLEFIRKAYGPGDQVSAAVNVARGTGEPFARQKLTAVVTVDDQEVSRLPITTDDKGNAVVKFGLPGAIAREDGLLTILADDGGVTESIQKRIPIVLGRFDVALFPEGGVGRALKIDVAFQVGIERIGSRRPEQQPLSRDVEQRAARGQRADLRSLAE